MFCACFPVLRLLEPQFYPPQCTLTGLPSLDSLSLPHSHPPASRNHLANHLLALSPCLVWENSIQDTFQPSPPSLPASSPAGPVPWSTEHPHKPVIVQGQLASEIKVASAFGKILGQIACHFRKALKYSLPPSFAITTSFSARFKCPCKQLFTLWPRAPLKGSF